MSDATGCDEDNRTEDPQAPADHGTVHVFLSRATTRVVLAGEIDDSMRDELQDAINEAAAAQLPVEVDVHHVTFIGSVGVAFIARMSARTGHRVRLLRATPTMEFLFDVTDLRAVVDIVGSPGDGSSRAQ